MVHLTKSRFVPGLLYVTDPHTGRSYPVPAGAEGDDDKDKDKDGKDGKDDSKDDKKSEEDEPKTFTQDELNRIATKEKNEGRRAAEKAMTDELGMSPQEAKKVLDAYRKVEDEKKSEADKAKEAADAAKAEAEQEKAEAAKERHTARVERLLYKAGVDPEKLERAMRSMDVEVGADDDTVQTEIGQLKDDIPAFFSTETPGKTPGNVPGGKPPPPKASENAFERGAERAKSFQGTGRVLGPQPANKE